MKKVKSLLLTALSLVLVIGMLAGCSSKPAPEDAQAYVKAVLDAICLGEYDHSVKLADIEAGSEGEMREQMIDEVLASFGSEQGLSDDVKADFKECMLKAFSLAKYTVGDAVATDDGGYDVTVSVEPLRMYDGFAENLESTLEKRVTENAGTVISMSQEEQYNFVMGVIIEMLNKNLEDPKYDAAEEVTVHYGLLDEEQKLYGCSKEDGERLGAKLFSQDGLQ